MPDNYRINNVLELNPLFISLGLPPATFKSFNPQVRPTFFDAAVNCGPLHPDCLWLFKGADYHRYNLRQRKFELTQSPISEFAKPGAQSLLPPGFFGGMDTVTYGGSAFPDQFSFFSEDTYITLAASGSLTGRPDAAAQAGWTFVEGPRGVLGAWAVGVWTNPDDGRFRKPGIMVGLHAQGARFPRHVHFFRNGEYVLHDLQNWHIPGVAVPIKQAWKLPSPFTEQIDLAFYGAGPEAQKIYFFSGMDFVLYDPEYDQVIRSGKIEQEFPGFASFMNRPQLFLVESTSLRTYLGPTVEGALLDTHPLGPRAKISRVMVIETLYSSTTSTQSSLLEVQDAGTVQNFNDRVDKATSEKEGSDSYNYRLKADAHGEAQAKGFWGGEVNASVSAQGGTDALRKEFASSVFKAVSSQVTESTQRRVVRTVATTEQIGHTEHRYESEAVEQKNPFDYPITIGFFALVQSFVGLLVLNSVRIAYSDGFNPRVVDLTEFPQLLDDVLAPGQSKDTIVKYVVGELSRIVDANNNKQTLLSEGGDRVELKPILTTVFELVAPDGTIQKIAVPGIVKMVKDWMTQTRNMNARAI
jgi:hypothetical protein